MWPRSWKEWQSRLVLANVSRLRIVVSKPSVFSFPKQSAQINTLCLVSAATTHVDLKLTAGEVWVFGDLAGGAARWRSAQSNTERRTV